MTMTVRFLMNGLRRSGRRSVRERRSGVVSPVGLRRLSSGRIPRTALWKTAVFGSLLFLAGAPAFARLDLERIRSGTDSDLTEQERETLLFVLDLIVRTPTGGRIIAAADSKARFTIRPMTENLGLASPDGTIALGSWRMELAESARDEKSRKTHVFVLADVTSHELTHSAQFAVGLGRIPADASFEEAVALRMMMELEAKLNGEVVQQEILSLPEYENVSVQLITAYSEMLGRTALAPEAMKDPERSARTAFIRAMWEGLVRDETGRYSDKTIWGIRGWNRIYWRRAALSELGRLRAGGVLNEERLKEAFSAYVRRMGADLTPEYFMKTMPLRTKGSTAAFYENGTKRRETSVLANGAAVEKSFNDDGELVGLRQIAGPPLTVYRETNESGGIVCEIPMKNGVAEGIGRETRFGQTIRTRFQGGAAKEAISTQEQDQVNITQGETP